MLRRLESQLEARGFEHRFWIPPQYAQVDLAQLGVSVTALPEAGSGVSPGSGINTGMGRMLLVGNGRSFWEHFLRAVREEPERLSSPHPLDEFVEQSLRDALSASASSAAVVFGHCQYPGGYAPLQRWAERAGALALSPSHLSVHPVVGPWLALRALLVFDERVEQNPSPGAVPAAERTGLPCARCSAPCLLPFEEASRISETAPTGKRVTDHWRHWLEIRDACPVGRQYRYSDEQIRYHYARDRSVLLSSSTSRKPK
jgi:hypothetical protein